MSLARNIADLGSSATRLDTVGSNVVTNGSMSVSQRGTSFTGLGADGESYNLDRFVTFASSTAGRATITQDADSPDGFANSLKVACTTADTSVAAGEIFFLQYRIEGQDLQRFAKGTSAAKEFAVSFYVKGNANATYVCELYDVDNDRHVAKTFSVTTGWTRVEIIFPADTTGAFGDDNARSLDLTIWLHAGSTYTSGTLPLTWDAKVNANRAVGATTSIFDSTARTFFITGLQLQETSVTDFEHRTFGDELARCQRYYYVLADGNSNTLPTGSYYNGSLVAMSVIYPVEMRAQATVTNPSVTDGYGIYRDSAFDTFDTFNSGGRNTKRGVTIDAVSGVSGTAGHSGPLATNSADALVAFDAEL